MTVNLRTLTQEKREVPVQRNLRSFVVCLALLLMAAALVTPALGQAPPLNFGNNFFVTGDYIVAGAYGMTTKFATNNGVSYAVGTISVPDTNPGITGTKQVPQGAQIVAALLYWQTVEKVGVKPGAPGSGQNGYFRPLLFTKNGNPDPNGPAAPGYLISGTNVSGSTTVSWSAGGCGGGSTGKLLRTYRADVAGGLPVDNNGNSTANGSFEVRLPSVGNATPLTLGATLVVIYRIPAGAGGPNIKLNSILILDGDYSQSNAQLTMTQPMPGPYGPIDADANTVTRLTHIVGSGQSNKFQTVYLGPDANHLTQLPSLYGNNLPAFPGYYGKYWDNPTWTSASGKSPLPPGALDATTQVVPSMSNQGCVSWGAVIMSTTVDNPDGDGILKSWKDNGGYCDYLANPSCTGLGDAAWIALPDAKIGMKDIYLHYDYMCSKVTAGKCVTSPIAASLSAVGASSGATATYTGNFSPLVPAGALVTVSGFTKGVNNGQFFVVSGTTTQLVVNNANAVAENNPATATYGDYSFDPTLAIDPLDNKDAVQKTVDAFSSHTGSAGTEPFVLHVERGNAIQEKQTSCADTDTDANGNLTCIFPNEPGTIGFREGLAWIKNSTIDTGTGLLGCDPSSPNCVGFQHGKKDSYHYALFSHGIGLASWFLSDASLQSVTQSGTTVTFTTKSPHGLMPIAVDSVCSKANGYIGRVTVIYAITNPNLNGTFCAQAVGNPPAANKFAITLSNKPPLPGTILPKYTRYTDPNLSVADGNVTSMSGYSDLGGQNSVISLGEGGWAPAQNLNPNPSEGNKWNVKAGTFMHEVGHTLGLTHGGTFLDNYKPSANPPSLDYTPTYEVNCKPNVQSVMSYVFQFDLLQAPGPPGNQAPVKVLDYSKDPLSPDAIPTLMESTPDGLTGLSYPYTSWFLPSAGPLPSNHCDGSPTVAGENSYVYTNQPVLDFTYSAGQDINFNGSITDVMHPHNEWEGTPAAADGSVGLSSGVDLQQVSAAGTVSAIGPGGEAGGLKPSGTGGGLKPAGTGGGLKPAGTGGAGFTPAGGGGGFKPAGTGGASFELTHNQASSYPRPPQNLFIKQEEASPRLIDLNWFAASFGTAVQYNIYRSAAVGPFTQIASVPGSQTMYTDTVTCNTGGYHYRVTAVTSNDAGTQLESSPSNTVPASGDPLLTGCYTVSKFSVPASAVQGTTGLQVTWTLTDDFFETPPGPWSAAASGNSVTRVAANTLVAIGPLPNTNCTTSGRTALVTDGNATQAGIVDNGSLDVFTSSANNFTFTWNRTDAFCAGSYTFELDLDHVNGSPAQKQAGPNALQLSIDINDQDTPRITTLTLPSGTVGLAYTDTLTEDGGTAPFTWTVTGLPAGISQQPAYSPNLSGTACVAGPYAVNASVTDAKSNSGTQAFSLQINQASTTTSVASSLNASTYGQAVTFTATVAPQYSCTPTGRVTFYDGAAAISGAITLLNATASYTTTTLQLAAGMHSITAVYSGDSNFYATGSGGSTATALSQTVNKAITTTSVVSSLNASTYGQAVTFTATVAPQYAGTPTVTVTFEDGGVALAGSSTVALSGGTASFTTTNTELMAGSHTITAVYSGDFNFYATGAGGSMANPLTQTVNKASTQIVFNSVSPSPEFVGQPITVSYTFSVVPPGAGSPSGSVTVLASDTSSCTAVFGAGMCTLAPAPTTAGNITFTINYPGDGNFVGSGANSSYNVYQLVFTTQPSNTGVGLTITPAVVVTAEDSGNTTLATFTGGITVAIGSGPGALSGTTMQSAVNGVATFGDLSINKIANGYTLTAAPSGGVPSSASNAFNIDTFYLDSQGNFGTLDLPTGTVTQIGAATVPGSNGIDLTPSLQVYAYNTSNQLFQIAPSTGVATQVGTGTTGSIPDQATTGALTDGSYFGIDAVTGNLYKIDLTTGATTQVGGVPTGAAVLPAGCNLDSSLSGSAGSPSVLYYTIGYTGASCTAFPDTLYQINPADGTSAVSPVTITVSGSGVNEFVGSAFVGGTLYGFTAGGQEYTIDPGTGVATSVANTAPTTAIIGAGSQ